MARGRLVSRTLGSSRKFAALQHHAGKLAEFAQSLYPLIIANADDFGRMAGDAFTVKHAVFPSSPRRESEFHAALIAMHRSRLIHLFEHEGQQVLAIMQFDRHQPGLSKRTKSQFPEPPGIFTEIPESPGNSKATELNRTEQKRTELIQSPLVAGTEEAAERKEENHDIRAFIKRFCELYAKYRHGARYFVRREKDVPLVRALLGAYGLERLVKLAAVLLKTDDEWVQETDRGIGILSTKATWLDERLAAYEAKHGPLKVAS